MATLDYFTVLSNRLSSIGADFIDPDALPDEDIVYAFVDFIPREPTGTVHWLSGLTPPRGIQLDTVRGRYSPEDGKLRTLSSRPFSEKQLVTATGGTIVLTYAGQSTAGFAATATPPQVQTALENLSNINVGDVYVTGAAQNERQTVTFTGAPTGGQFILVYDGLPTIPLSRNASAGTVKQALQNIPTIGSDGCSVSGPVGGPWVVEFTGYLAGVNVNTLTYAFRSETQTITPTASPTTGTFQLTYSGQTTPDITYPATAATIQAALEALSNLAPGDVVVSGPDVGPWTFTFAGTKANSDQPAITVVPERDEVQTVTITGSPSGGTFFLTYAGQPTVNIPRFALPGQVRAALEGLPNMEPGDVKVVGNLGGPWTVTFVGPRLGTSNVAQLTATAALTPSGGVTIATVTQGLGVLGGTIPSAVTTIEPVFLTGGTSPAPSISVTQTGSTGTPWTVNFVGPLEGTNVAQMTAVNANVATVQAGASNEGVMLVANTPILELGNDVHGFPNPLIYDVKFTVPDLNPLKVDRIITPFAIEAPTTANATVDLASVVRLPPKAR